VRSIAIYVEGGGDTAQQKAELRVGLDRLLIRQKDAARAKRLGWKIVPCGGRSGAYRAFVNAVRKGDDPALCILLVDSEEGLSPELPVLGAESAVQRRHRERQDARVRRDHLVNRDGWNFEGIEDDRLHLMVVCMETWIVADPDTMASYYGSGFRANSLPRRLNLEEEPKTTLYARLADATRNTSKGAYSESNNAKIKHAAKLLARLNPAEVAGRCPRFATFTSWLDHQIEEA
jgi:hypothetical protein